jgi:DHA3 family tetracycline resistance protein-like MFS transporter
MLFKRDAARVYLVMSGVGALLFSMIVVTNIVYQVEVAHLDPLRVLLIGSVLEATCLLFQLPSGLLADRYSRRAAVVAGTALWGAGFVVEGLFPSFWPIVVAQVIWGIGVTFVDGADSAWITEEVGSERAANLFVRGGQLGSIGSLVGIFIGSLLASLQLSLPIVIGGALFVMLAVWLAFAMPEAGFQPATSWGLGQARSLIRLKPVLVTIFAITFFAAMSSEAFDRLQQVHLLKDTGLPTLFGLSSVLWFGIIAAVASVIGLGGMQLVRRYVDLTSHVVVSRGLFLLVSVLTASLLGFALSRTFAVAVCFLWIASLMRRVYGPVQRAWLNQSLEPSTRATLFSFDGQVDAFGQILAGPVIGLVATLVSLPAALVVGAIFLAPTLLLFAFTVRQPGIQPADDA